jgi:TPP-dependent pyruvate/acetoin dehydrogenase alpha subunit
VGPGEDWHLGYRMPQEAEAWRENDPLVRLAARLNDDCRRQIEGEVDCEIEVAFAFAELSPEPKAESLYTDVVARPQGARRTQSTHENAGTRAPSAAPWTRKKGAIAPPPAGTRPLAA